MSQQRDNWPIDPRGFVFLPRALEQIGRTKHGDDWTFKAQFSLLPEIDPTRLDARTKGEIVNALVTRLDIVASFPAFKPFVGAIEAVKLKIRRQRQAEQVERAHFASGMFRTGPQPPPPPARGYVPLEPSLKDICRETLTDIGPAQWHEVAQLLQRESVAIREAHQRVKELSLPLIIALEAGELKAAARMADGTMADVPPNHWNGDNLFPRFIFGVYDPGNPFVARVNPRRRYLLFLQSDSVGAWSAPAIQTKAARAGPPEKYDWEEAKLFVLQELNRRGDFANPQNKVKGWKSQNNLVDMVIEHLAKHSDDSEGPSPTRVKDKIKPWLEEWRKSASNSGQ